MMTVLEESCPHFCIITISGDLILSATLSAAYPAIVSPCSVDRSCDSDNSGLYIGITDSSLDFIINFDVSLFGLGIANFDIAKINILSDFLQGDWSRENLKKKKINLFEKL